MIDTVKYFNINPCDIMQFLPKFLYGLITDIMFQNVLLCFDVNINIYYSNKKYQKMIRNICPYDSSFYFSVYNSVCKHMINCNCSVSLNPCWSVNYRNHSTAKHQIYKALNFFIVFKFQKIYIEVSHYKKLFFTYIMSPQKILQVFPNDVVSSCGGPQLKFKIKFLFVQNVNT